MRVNRLIEIAVLHHIKDRREGLFQHRPCLFRHFDKCRLYIIGIRRTRIHAPAAIHHAVMRLGRFERLLHAVESRLVHQRSDKRRCFERIADGDGGVGLFRRGTSWS